MKSNSNGGQRASYALDIHGISSMLLFDIQHTLVHLYIFLLCKGGIIFTISLDWNFIILIFLIEHMFADSL